MWNTQTHLKYAQCTIPYPNCAGLGPRGIPKFKEVVRAPSCPFAAWQPLWGSSLTELRSGVRVLKEVAFPAVIALARAGQEAAFPAVVQPQLGQGRKPPSLPS